MSLRGPILLLSSEMCHAMMLIMQQVAVQSYWPEPMLLISASAALGIPVTIASMMAAHKMVTPYPPHHPVSDFRDVFVMSSNSTILAVSLLSHLIFHVAMDVNHITSLKHMSSLARSLCDAVKLAAMWMIGKLAWFAGEYIWEADWPKKGGTLAVLGEPWRPNSWMMIPGLFMIGYAMLMFKFAVFVPIQIKKSPEDGKWHVNLVQAEETEADDPYSRMDVGIDEDFYGAAFTNRKIRHNMRKHLAAMTSRKQSVIGWQAAYHKIRKANADGGVGGVQAGNTEPGVRATSS